MMPRILFVDDNPLVLEGLRRAFRPMRNEWEFVFTTGGQQALSAMAAAPVDVAVSDIQLGMMSGADFIREACQIHPDAVRFILSGHSDPPTLLEAAGLAHRVFAKPCPVECLQSAIKSAIQIRRNLANDAVWRVVCRTAHLPVHAATVTRLLDGADPHALTLADAAQLAASDPGLTAQMLKLVNSPYADLPRPVCDPHSAMRPLGLEVVRVMTRAARHSWPAGNGMESVFLQDLWTHSAKVAAAAKHIAVVEGADESTVHASYGAGLLHDLGKVLLLRTFGATYFDLVKKSCTGNVPMHALEKNALGVDHAEVGACVLGLWGLPALVVDAVAHHHAPLAGDTSAVSPQMAVHAANMLVDRPDGSRVSGVDTDYVIRVNLDSRLVVWKQALAGKRDEVI
jgi:putative nucleotidyltransferase with HDIG domain